MMNSGSGMMATASLTMVALWALLAGLVFGVLRGLTQRREVDTRSDAERVLDERLARGEIDAEQYRSARDLLRRG
jgi:putative membrane protein